MRLKGKVALVTGAGGGFGEGIARAFVNEGAHVIVADIDGDAARRVLAELGPAAAAIQGDVSRGPDVHGMVHAALQVFGGLDIVVNTAGAPPRSQPMLEVDEAEFDRACAMNVKPIYWLARHAVPVLRSQGRGGAIINVGGSAAPHPRPGLVWHDGTRGAVNALTLAMAAELAPDRIRVNAVCPAPDGATPADIANACLWLAEDAAGAVTGILLPIGGGGPA